MSEKSPLPLKSIVLFIAFGVMVATIIFIFAKRQITRFALKSRGLHYSIAGDAPKRLRHEIESKLKRTKEVKYEPILLPQTEEENMLRTGLTPENAEFYYRMKAMDSISLLYAELKKVDAQHQRSVATHTLRSYLLERRLNGKPQDFPLDIIEKLTESYDLARHGIAHFGINEYNEFLSLLNQLIAFVHQHQNSDNRDNSDDIIEEDDFNETDRIQQDRGFISATSQIMYKIPKTSPKGLLRMRQGMSGAATTCLVTSSADDSPVGEEKTETAL